MKRLITTLFAITLFLPGIVSARKLKPEVERAMANGAMAKIHLKVLDEKGIIVTNASVRVAMDMPKGEYAIYGRTDTNGLCVVQGKTNGNYIDFLVGKGGYYGSYKRVSFVPMGEEHDVKENKWQPYGDKLEIVLNKVRNPIVLLKDPERKFILTKALNKWIGYDLNLRDYVAPHGTGKETDFEIFFDWDGECFSAYKGMKLRIRFGCPFSGYYNHEIDDISDFKGPYSASPNSMYMKDAEFFDEIVSENTRKRQFFDLKYCWVLRSRCKVDNKGNLVSAHYSVVNNIEFGYEKRGIAALFINSAFNPTANDTNLEDIETAERSRHFIQRCEPPHEEPKKSKKWFPWK